MNLNWPHECLVSLSFPVLKDPQSLLLISSDKFKSWHELSGIARFHFSIFFPNDLNADLDGFLVVFSDFFFFKASKRKVMSDNKPGFIKIVEGWNDADSKMKHKINKTNRFKQLVFLSVMCQVHEKF